MANGIKFPSIKDVAHDIRACARQTDWYGQPRPGEDAEYCDVRLQVVEDGRWYVHSGPSDYDQDHRGFWGASSFPRGRFDSRAIARDLLDQVKDQAAQ